MGLFDIFKRHSKKRKQRRSLKAKKLQQAKASSLSSSASTSAVKASAARSSLHQHSLSVASSQSASRHASLSASQAHAQSVRSQSVSASQSVATSASASSQSLSQKASAAQVVQSQSNRQSVEQSAQSSSGRSENNHQIYAKGLAKSRSTFGQKLNSLFANFRSVDNQFFERLEDTLIEADVGFDMAIKISDALRHEVKIKNVKSRRDVQNVIIQKMIEMYDHDGSSEDNRLRFAKSGPTVFLFVGVNGAGKTTTIGKMAHFYHQAGKKVLLAAADTFRAGAIQQLADWAKLDSVDIVKRPEHSDPASVVYDAVHKAKAENYDILFVDTAGRLQNKVNLMNELAKMKKVLTREIPQAPHEVILVLDATTGQNALSQAKLFKQVTNVTGIILTKLDGTAKGGIILAIRHELHLPVKYVGLGEKVDDLRRFNASDFVDGLFGGLFK